LKTLNGFFVSSSAFGDKAAVKLKEYKNKNKSL